MMIVVMVMMVIVSGNGIDVWGVVCIGGDGRDGSDDGY